MGQAVVVKCPGCQRELRVPLELLQKTIRCKYCGSTIEARKKPKADPPPLAKTSPSPHVEPLPTASPLPGWMASVSAPVAPAPVPPPQYVQPQVQAQYGPPPGYYAAPESGNEAYTEGRHESAFNAAKRHRGRGNYQGPAKSVKGTWIAVGLAVTLMSALVVLILVKPDLFSKKETDPPKDLVENNNEPKPPEIKGETPKTNPKGVVTGAFPRRLLAINISNYLFVNPTHYGDSRDPNEKNRKDTHSALIRVAERWRIPTEQVFELTDGPSSEAPKSARPAMDRLPMKPNVKKTIDLFCDTSRDQDRILFLFSGHVIEVGGEAFLVPIEGEFDVPESLIPIKDIYKKFGECKAQEKCIIWDVCRYNPDRGVERPSFGKMTEGLEKVLHSPPEGVSVWTACSQGEYSYEYDFAQAGPKMAEANGSVFLSHFRLASAQGVLNKTGKKNSGGIQSPDEPLPIKPLVEFVKTEVSAFVPVVAVGQKQTPKFTPSEATSTVEYDPKAALATSFEIPVTVQGADSKEVEQIFAEFRMPPLKALRKDVEQPKFDIVFPFSAEALKKYKSDGVTFEMVASNPEKYPFRAPIVEAYEELRNLQTGKDTELPEDFRSPISDVE